MKGVKCLNDPGKGQMLESRGQRNSIVIPAKKTMMKAGIINDQGNKNQEKAIKQWRIHSEF
jgi:hypothetical protein